MTSPDIPNERPTPVLDRVSSPRDLASLSLAECDLLAEEIRQFIVDTVVVTGGHLGSNLGAVELTIALHRVFDSPNDVILFDTGHQAYVHKLLTGRREGFASLKKAGGLSGYPNRAESPHDVIENSHASTALSWAHGIAAGFAHSGQTDRRAIAVVGDGALTGGMAYEALNNLGHAGVPVVIVLNDNGRSYAPTISRLSGQLTQLRLDPRYVQVRERVRGLLRQLPTGFSSAAITSIHGVTSAVREVVEPHVFFEALGVRYTGPIDGHDVSQMEHALRRAASWPGPIVLHMLTTKGKGYGPAEDDDIAHLHDVKVAPAHQTTSPPARRPAISTQTVRTPPAASRAHQAIAPSDEGALRPASSPIGESYTDAFSKALIALAERDPDLVAITAAMPGPTGLLGFEEAFPDRFFDVGIAEQHAMTAAAGMAHAGLHPVLAVYSTFLQRCVDQWNLDVGLHGAPVVVVADRAGVTGDDGPSHHGIYDMHSALSIPGVAVYAPAEPAELGPALEAALAAGTPALVRYPKTLSFGPLGPIGENGRHRVLTQGDPEHVIVGVGKLARAAMDAARIVGDETGATPTVVDPRVVRPLDPALVELLLDARVVVIAEDGIELGGAGGYIASVVRTAARRLVRRSPEIVTLGVPTAYILQAKPDDILADLGLDGPGIAARLKETIALNS